MHRGLIFLFEGFSRYPVIISCVLNVYSNGVWVKDAWTDQWRVTITIFRVVTSRIRRRRAHQLPAHPSLSSGAHRLPVGYPQAYPQHLGLLTSVLLLPAFTVSSSSTRSSDTGCSTSRRDLCPFL